MPNVRAPLFGFDAQGTLDKTLTYTSPGRQRIARSIPTHLPTYSLPQRNQRFLYRLGIALWNALDAAGRATYRAATVGRPVTAMNLFLREWLTTFPNLLYAFAIEEGHGHLMYDRQDPDRPATLVGPAWHSHDHSYYLQADGIDDYAILPTGSLSLNYPAISIVFKAAPLSFNVWTNLVIRYTIAPINGYTLTYRADGIVHLRTALNDVGKYIQSSPGDAVLDEDAVMGFSAWPATGAVYKNGQDVTDGVPAYIQPADAAVDPTIFAWGPGAVGPLHCRLYWLIFFDRALTQAEHLSIARAFMPSPLP